MTCRATVWRAWRWIADGRVEELADSFCSRLADAACWPRRAFDRRQELKRGLIVCQLWRCAPAGRAANSAAAARDHRGRAQEGGEVPKHVLMAVHSGLPQQPAAFSNYSFDDPEIHVAL